MYNEDDVKRAKARVHEMASPSQLKVIDMVDAAFEAECQEFESRREAEDTLRAWAENLTGVRLDMSEIEELQSKARSMKTSGTLTYNAKRGTICVYKTAFNTLDRVDRYINTLERTVIDITNNSQFTPLSTLDLIKLAFKRLIKRRSK